jgi:tetratricopeptide (TPR) repeat protein
MTDSNESNLFGNKEEYSSQRQQEGFELFSRALPSSAEPLFPTAPQVETISWESITPASIEYSYTSNGQGYENPAYENLTDETQSLESQSSVDQSYDSQGFDRQSYDRQNFGAVHLNKSEDVETVSVEPSLPVPLPTIVETPAAPPRPKPVLTEKELIFNRHFAVLMDLMQHGAWPQALEKLQAMRVEFPNTAMLDNLLDEATLKAELMAQWTHKIKGRRLTVGQEWIIRRSLPFLLLLALFVSGTIFYRTYIAPSRQVIAMERANQALIEEATGLVQVGQIDEAITLYNEVLSRDANNNAAQQGLIEAGRQSGLAVTYDMAIRVANKSNLKRSLLLLQSVKAKSPSFRDIDARLARVSSLLDAERTYILAEKSFAQRRWVDAIAYYEQTQLLASDYQAFRVGQQLIAAYFMASQKLMTQWLTPEFGTEQIRDFLRKAQAINNQNETLNTFLVQLDDFIKGERSLNNNNIDQAIQHWRELYEVQPTFLGGYLAEELYRAYLALASEIRSKDEAYARELYTFAAALPVHDSSEARSQLQNLGAAVPAAQPTPTPQPTVAYVEAAVVAAPVAPAAPVETPTPEPTAAAANTYQGWIAFRSTRGGSEQVYMMRGDGSEQQIAPEELRGRLETLYQDEHRGPDGRTAFVQSPAGRSDANIFIASSDGVNNTQVTDNHTDEYDPVWSATGDRIAFVSNHTGNDEIWVMRADGSEPRQLTFNDWQWDKHPTWAPDATQIAFFSNRSGQRQIWVMGSDGSNQRNLSNNVYDDWDPVWIK